MNPRRPGKAPPTGLVSPGCDPREAIEIAYPPNDRPPEPTADLVVLLSLGYAAAVIATRQGLRVIDGPPPCHGYRNGCVCGSCVERVRVGRRAKREQPRQPWQPTPAKRAA